MTRKTLLICGILASLLYVVADVLGGVVWQGYSHTAQGVSELMALGAPSRPLVLSLMTVHGLLLLAFALGVWQSANGKHAVYFTAVLLAADAVVGLSPIFVPVPLRGAVAGGAGLSVHLVLTGVNVLAIFLAIGFGAAAFGKGFRRYSIGTILVFLAFGTLAALDAPRVDARLPTPWLGITERILIYAYLLWLAAFAAILLCRRDTTATDDVAGRYPRGAVGTRSPG